MSREILKNIIDEFDPEKFIRFFREKNREFTPRTEELTVYNDDNFSNCTRIGKIDFPEGSNMIVCSLNTDKSLTERSGKKSQYEKGKKILKDTQSDSGIFIFYDSAGNFRFSLIYANYLGNKRDWSTFKRFTYFVSKEFTNKTFIQRIGDSDFSSLENIKDAFSVEKVNKEFYKEIAIKFTELVGGQRVVKSKVEKFRPLIKLPGTDDHQKLQEFAVRMIGRIVFCWFLKKKKSQNGIPLIPENLLSVSAVEKNKNYYHSVLEKLFFEVLNTKQEERKKFKGYELYKDIPFLNGGLFEPQTDDQYKPSLVNSLIIPDKWMAEFFNILESYNFTIDENTSIDVELSIDPEMLGRIFENLLAEINPKTGESARKSTGSYYTPRPIVEYMVDESLKQYLITKTDIPESKLSMLLSYSSEESEISDKDSVKIINALDEIKILDPACGSGAFPIGILQKMLLILQKIDKKSSKWLEKKLNKIESSVLRKELKEKFNNENLDYIRKLGLIQDSIYGVDIQSIAVEISKLRCFLTLIVDEDVDDKKPNRGIIPLPNLEFKFVAANTLISLPEEEGSLFDESEYIKQLEGLRDEFFTSYGQDKLEIESDFITIQEKMVKKLLRNGITGGRAFELAGWNPFFNEKADWFDPKWMFGIENGFDIVIGNPPYGNILSITEKSLFAKQYKSYQGNFDVYFFFIELSIRILKNKSITSFITPDTWINIPQAENLRKVVLQNFSILQILKLDANVFEQAAVNNIVFILKKGATVNKCEITIVNQWKEFDNFSKSNLNKRYSIEIANWVKNKDHHFNIFQNNETGNLLNKVKSNTKLGEELFDISQGIIPYSRENHSEKIVKERSFHSSTKIDKSYGIWVQGRAIKKYFIDLRKLEYLKYGNWLHRPRKAKYFNGERILIQEITGGKPARISATVIDLTIYHDPGIISCLNKTKTNIKYLIAILNSTLISWYHINSSPKGSRNTFPKVLISDIRNLPFRIAESKSQNQFTILVEKILNKKSQNKDTTDLENQIDVMVYKLYELTYEEVKTVDPEFWMSEEEYKQFEFN